MNKAHYIIYLINGFVKFEEVNDDHSDIVNLHAKYPDAREIRRIQSKADREFAKDYEKWISNQKYYGLDKDTNYGNVPKL
jgi:hypothetical protein